MQKVLKQKKAGRSARKAVSMFTHVPSALGALCVPVMIRTAAEVCRGAVRQPPV